MTSLTTGVTAIPALPTSGITILYVDTGTQTQVGGTDTVPVTLANYGIANFKGIKGCVHTTDGSVVVADSPTTAVSAGTLTITLGSSNNNKRRVYEIWGT